jgi:hypothetical protein
MAWNTTPGNYAITVPIADADRDSGTQTEIAMWTEVKDFMADSGPVITKANNASPGPSADAASALSTGSDGKPALTAIDLRSQQLHGYFQQDSLPAIETGRLLHSKNDCFATCVILDDGTDSAFWPEKFQFYYQDPTGGVRRTGFFNEYGEIRSVSAKRNTVALRAFGSEQHWPGDGVEAGQSRRRDIPIFEVADDRDQRYRLFGVFVDGGTGNGRAVVNYGNTNSLVSPALKPDPADNFTVFGTTKLYGTINVTGASTLTGNVSIGGTLGVSGLATVANLTVTGTLTAPGFVGGGGGGGGTKVTASPVASPPTDPAIGDVWIQY